MNLSANLKYIKHSFAKYQIEKKESTLFLIKIDSFCKREAKAA